MGAGERAQSVIADMRREIEAVRSQATEAQAGGAGVGGRKRLRVFCEEWGRPLIASQKWVAELVEVAGGEFLGEPGAQRSAESVLAEVAAWCGAGDRVPLEKIVRDWGWGEMRAVKASRVYCIRDELWNTPAPTLIRGLRALAAAIYPECFPQPDGLRCIAEGSVQTDAPLPR